MDVPEIGWNDDIQTSIVKITDEWIIGVTPMIYNNRVVLMNKSEWRTGYTAGFCYDKGAAAALAALAWDPEEDFYPAGFKKIACDSRQKEGK
jgi:hypothetical protein